jgi:hypothetical protein
MSNELTFSPGSVLRRKGLRESMTVRHTNAELNWMIVTTKMIVPKEDSLAEILAVRMGGSGAKGLHDSEYLRRRHRP